MQIGAARVTIVQPAVGPVAVGAEDAGASSW